MFFFWTHTVFFHEEIHTLRSLFLVLLLWNKLHAKEDDGSKYSHWSPWSCCYEHDLYRARDCLISCKDAKIFDRKPCEILHCGDLDLISTEAEPNTTASSETPSTSTELELTSAKNLYYTSDHKRRHNRHDVGTVEFVSPSRFGVGMITTLCVSLLVIANFVFTLFFYRAWKKKQKIRRRQSDIEQRPYNVLEKLSKSRKEYSNTIPEKMSKGSKEDIYSNIRESISSFSTGRSCTYTTINSKDRNTYISSDFSGDSVPPVRGGNRDNLKTLTTLFQLHSPEVTRTISELKTINVVSER
ncbi:uncharacterized protein LOC133176555 [Saccostrea echinata]|uniref:uncharacterized protein LOC133176555 n=1 Tax=Saccostrea echinata TaxID=191078 RepID=UPI002A7EA9A3|nr:uncharacterized protein LOC133176555 [Saccostrea echinata]